MRAAGGIETGGKADAEIGIVVFGPGRQRDGGAGSAVMDGDPMALWRGGDVVTLAELLQAHIGEAEFWSELVERFGPDKRVQFSAGERVRAHVVW